MAEPPQILGPFKARASLCLRGYGLPPPCEHAARDALLGVVWRGSGEVVSCRFEMRAFDCALRRYAGKLEADVQPSTGCRPCFQRTQAAGTGEMLRLAERIVFELCLVRHSDLVRRAPFHLLAIWRQDSLRGRHQRKLAKVPLRREQLQESSTQTFLTSSSPRVLWRSFCW